MLLACQLCSWSPHRSPHGLPCNGHLRLVIKGAEAAMRRELTLSPGHNAATAFEMFGIGMDGPAPLPLPLLARKLRARPGMLPTRACADHGSLCYHLLVLKSFSRAAVCDLTPCKLGSPEQRRTAVSWVNASRLSAFPPQHHLAAWRLL